jgi:hypothetical protein
MGYLFKKASGQVLPDGIFSQQKSQFDLTLSALGILKVDKFNGHLRYIPVIWYFSMQFGNLVAKFGIHISPRSGTLCQEKSGNPDLVTLLLDSTKSGFSVPF